MNSEKKLIIFTHIRKSCTSNGVHLTLSIKTGNVHIEKILSQAVVITSKSVRMEGKGLKLSQS